MTNQNFLKLVALDVCTLSRCENQRYADRLDQKWPVPLQNPCLPLLDCLVHILRLFKHRDFVMQDDHRQHGYLLYFRKPGNMISIRDTGEKQYRNYPPAAYAAPGPGRERKKCVLVMILQKAAGTELVWIGPVLLYGRT